MNSIFITTAIYLVAVSSVHASEGKHLFILSGQSNMGLLNPGKSFTPAVEAVFGKENVIVVKHAKGGESIRGWYKNWQPKKGWKPKRGEPKEAKGFLYHKLMSSVKESIKEKKIATVTFVWMQGESDAREGLYEVYEKSFNGVMKQLREDLGRQDINFVIGRLSDAYPSRFTKWDEMRKLQVKIAESDPRGEWVDTDDLNDGTRKGQKVKNDLHYTELVELGQRFAEKAIALINNEPSGIKK